MKNIFYLVFVLSFSSGLAQSVELIEQASKDAYANKSYIYTKSVTITPGFSVNAATQGTFYVRPAEAAKIPTNVPPNLEKNFLRVENIFQDDVYWSIENDPGDHPLQSISPFQLIQSLLLPALFC